jgi:hypothetical protein
VTAIVAIIENDTIYMGGDSAGVDPSRLSLITRKDPKVFKNGPFIMGFTSSYRMGQLLRYTFRPPEHPNNVSVDRYMVTIFVETVRECLRSGGYTTINNNNENGGNFLVGYRGKLFNINDDFQVGIPANNYDAIGCGGSICLGSLHTTHELNIPPRDRIKMALKAAEEFSAGIRGPFNILEG